MAQTQEQRVIANLESYLLLEGRKHGIYQYPNTLVPMERSHLNENWNQATASLHQQREYMLTIRQFADLLHLLKTGHAYDGAGKHLGKKKQETILEEITAERSPWRSEWLDHFYLKKGSALYVKYHILQGDGSPKQVEEPLEDCLMEDKQIDIFDWLAGANSQGLPPKNVRSGKLNYWYPRADHVAGFRADAAGVSLVCNRDPQLSNAGLGVRAAISTGNISTKISQEESRLEEALKDMQEYLPPINLPKVREILREL